MAAATVQAFTTEIVGGEKYVGTVYRGSNYLLRQGSFGWEVSIKRVGYGGRFHVGGFKSYDTLPELVAGCKAFGDEARVLDLFYGVAQEPACTQLARLQSYEVVDTRCDRIVSAPMPLAAVKQRTDYHNRMSGWERFAYRRAAQHLAVANINEAAQVWRANVL